MKNSTLKLIHTLAFLLIVCLVFGQNGGANTATANSNSNVADPNVEETVFLINENRGPIVEEEEEEEEVFDNSGGAGSNFGIKNDWPSNGKMLAKPAKIAWSGSKGPFELTVKNDSTTIYRIVTKNPHHDIPLHAIALEENMNYMIDIASLGDDGLISTTDTIRIVDKKFVKAVLASFQENEKYINATDFDKEMIEAVTLEKNGLKYKAKKYYTKYRMNHVDDATARNMYSGFKRRAGVD